MGGVRSGWRRALWMLALSALAFACGSRSNLLGGAPPDSSTASGNSASAAAGNAANAGAGSTLEPASNTPNCAVSIAARGFWQCGMYQDGSVWCWGSSGPSNFEPASQPRRVDIDDVAKLVLGATHACAIKTSGELWCWGNNESGQIDVALKTPLGPTRVTLPPLQAPLQEVGLEATRTCVLDALPVYCWGTDSHGSRSGPRPISFSNGLARSAMSDGTTDVLDEPGRIFSLNGWDEPTPLTAFGRHNAWYGGGVPACVLKRSGSLWCTDYLLETSDDPPLAKLKLRENVVQAGTGDLFMCALTVNGQVWCEGFNVVGQLGRGTTSTFEEGALIDSLADVSSLAVGEYSACALKADGSVWCWGSYGSGTSASAPVQVSGCREQSKAPPPPVLGPTTAGERLSEASLARGQAFCTCVGQATPTANCIEGENSAPNPICVTALTREPSAASYWNCLANNAWQEVDCYSGPACQNGFMPCPMPTACDPGGLEPVVSYCRRRSCALHPEQSLRSAQICDGIHDCSDPTDELNCRPDLYGFECNPESRIMSGQLCDHHSDCSDNSDELFCP